MTSTALRVHGLCQACNERPAARARGLCRVCWANIAIRERHPVVRPFPVARKDAPPQDRTATIREAKRLAVCPAGHLPCITCQNIVAVNSLLMARARRVQCLWSLCQDCKASVGTVRDGAVGMRGPYEEEE